MLDEVEVDEETPAATESGSRDMRWLKPTRCGTAPADWQVGDVGDLPHLASGFEQAVYVGVGDGGVKHRGVGAAIVEFAGDPIDQA
jgi:hypothetical protein